MTQPSTLCTAPAYCVDAALKRRVLQSKEGLTLSTWVGQRPRHFPWRPQHASLAASCVTPQPAPGHARRLSYLNKLYCPWCQAAAPSELAHGACNVFDLSTLWATLTQEHVVKGQKGDRQDVWSSPSVAEPGHSGHWVAPGAACPDRARMHAGLGVVLCGCCRLQMGRGHLRGAASLHYPFQADRHVGSLHIVHT